MADPTGPMLSQGALDQQTLEAYQFGSISIKSEVEEQLDADILLEEKAAEKFKDEFLSEKPPAAGLESIGEGGSEPFGEQSPDQ